MKNAFPYTQPRPTFPLLRAWVWVLHLLPRGLRKSQHICYVNKLVHLSRVLQWESGANKGGCWLIHRWIHNHLKECPSLSLVNMQRYTANDRAVAAGPVSLVSTGPLFPSLAACLALPISAISWRTPTKCPEAHRYHVETCEMAANSATELFNKSSNNFPFLQANN